MTDGERRQAIIALEVVGVLSCICLDEGDPRERRARDDCERCHGTGEVREVLELGFSEGSNVADRLVVVYD